MVLMKKHLSTSTTPQPALGLETDWSVYMLLKSKQPQGQQGRGIKRENAKKKRKEINGSIKVLNIVTQLSCESIICSYKLQVHKN